LDPANRAVDELERRLGLERVNCTVADLDRSIAFHTADGFSHDPAANSTARA
jgi:hypothetical protein